MLKFNKTVFILIALTILSCTKAELDLSNSNLITKKKKKKSDINIVNYEKCDVTPKESEGTHPTKNPKTFIKSDLTSGVKGVKLKLKLVIEVKGKLIENLSVDLWHCDAKGQYSQYGSSEDENFLRGRQMTNDKGEIVFNTIFPGWKEQRSAHAFISIKDIDGNTIKVTQLAFNQETQDAVFDTENYNGRARTKAQNDRVFADGLNCNLPDEVKGNITKGFIYTKKIIIQTLDI